MSEATQKFLIRSSSFRCGEVSARASRQAELVAVAATRLTQSPLTSIGVAAVTIPSERTRALLWAGGFLIELARDRSLPLAVRRRAVVIARHFPTIEDVSTLAYHPGLAPLSEVSSWEDGCPAGALTYGTRLTWPCDDGAGEAGKSRSDEARDRDCR